MSEAGSGVHRPDGPEGRIVIYRRHFEKLLACQKPLRDQIVIELSVLQALRSGEVSSLRVEWVDFESGDMQVLDSKKFRMYPIPLDPVMAQHLAQYIQAERLHEGILIQPLHNANHTGRKPGSKTVGAGLSVTQIGRIWERWCLRCNIPVMPTRVGRAYWATFEHFVLHKSVRYIQAILRHDDIQSTEHYLSNLVSYDDVKMEFYRGKVSPFGSGCARAEACPVSCPDCSCKFYAPRFEAQSVQSASPLLKSP